MGEDFAADGDVGAPGADWPLTPSSEADQDLSADPGSVVPDRDAALAGDDPDDPADVVGVGRTTDRAAWELTTTETADVADLTEWQPVEDMSAPASAAFALGEVPDRGELGWAAGPAPTEVSVVWANTVDVEQFAGFADPSLLGSAEPADLWWDAGAG